jgi:galactokinase
MTGGGFGGCIVALTEPGALAEGWKVTAVDGAHLLDES